MSSAPKPDPASAPRLSGEHRLVLERTLPAPPDRVYRAWIDPEFVARWFSPGEATVESATIDARVGGRFEIVMRGPDGATHSPRGQYEQLVPGEKLVFTWGWEHSDLVSRVTVELKPADGGTHLTLTHEGFADADDRDGHEVGWHGCFAKLGAALG